MIKNKVSHEIRCGSLFDPWKDIIYQKEKFDYILNDVSAISTLVAKKSSWFNDKIPCESGKDGTKLTLEIIKKSLKFLKKKGILQIPILSLSNRKKILKEAKKFFRVVKVDQSSNWFLPKEMIRFKKDLLNYRSRGYIDFEIKFNNIVCKTEVIICKEIK